MNRIPSPKRLLLIMLIAGSGLMAAFIVIKMRAYRSPHNVTRSPKTPLTPQEMTLRQLILNINHPPSAKPINTRSPSAAKKKTNQYLEKYNTMPPNLENLLQLYYGGTALVYERRAYRQVLRWESAVARIVQDYDRISTATILAVIKEETQGKTGSQVSSQKAVGLTQIKYQGAWSFLWNALFKTSINQNGITAPDYFNDGIRQRYRKQLNRIKTHLISQNLLFPPVNEDLSDFRQARSQTWAMLKKHLQKRYSSAEYQIAVDIAAMYLDHLTFVLNDYSTKVAKIKQIFDKSQVADIDQTRFAGSTQSVWKKIKNAFITDCIRLYREVNRFNLKTGRPVTDQTRFWHRIKTDITQRLGIDIIALIRERLAMIIKKANDPQTAYAAYHTGPTTIFSYMENARALPMSAAKYAKRVQRHQRIFADLAAARKIITYKGKSPVPKPGLSTL